MNRKSKGQALIEAVLIINLLVIFIIAISLLIRLSAIKIEGSINARNCFFNKENTSNMKFYNVRIKRKSIKTFWEDSFKGERGVITNEYSGIF